MLIKPHNKNKSGKGFTLLEILIALFIFTIVSLILATALRTVLSAQSSTEKHAERLEKLQIALLMFSRDVEQVINRDITDAEGSKEGALVGTRESVTFTHSGFANSNGLMQSSTLQRSRYRIEKDQLIRDTWAELDQLPHAPHSIRPLLTNIKQLNFRYLDKDNVFQNVWPPSSEKKEAGNNLPRAIEINLTLTQGGSIKQIYLLPQQMFPPEKVQNEAN